MGKTIDNLKADQVCEGATTPLFCGFATSNLWEILEEPVESSDFEAERSSVSQIVRNYLRRKRRELGNPVRASTGVSEPISRSGSTLTESLVSTIDIVVPENLPLESGGVDVQETCSRDLEVDVGDVPEAGAFTLVSIYALNGDLLPICDPLRVTEAGEIELCYTRLCRELPYETIQEYWSRALDHAEAGCPSECILDWLSDKYEVYSSHISQMIVGWYNFNSLKSLSNRLGHLFGKLPSLCEE
jgi:hypothetical protein